MENLDPRSSATALPADYNVNSVHLLQKHERQGLHGVVHVCWATALAFLLVEMSGRQRTTGEHHTVNTANSFVNKAYLKIQT